MPADPAVTADAPQTVETSSEAQETQNLPPISSEGAEALAQRLGIPAALRTGFSQEEPTSQAETQTEEQAETETSTEETAETETEQEELKPTAETEEAETEEEEESIEGKQPEWYQKRINRLTRQRRTAEEKAIAAEEKAEQLAAQLQSIQPVTVQPSLQEPLVDVQTEAQLAQTEKTWEIVRNQAEDNPDGWVANPGTAQEEVITPEQAKFWRRYANDLLTKAIPRKRAELAALPAIRAEAEKILPDLYKVGSADNNAMRTALLQFPQLAGHPGRDVFIARYLKGWKVEEAEKAGAKNGKAKLEVPEKILKAHEQREKVPLQRQTPPGRPLSNGVPKTEELVKTTEKLAQTGSPDALKAGLRQLGKFQQNAPKRQPALV